MAKDYEDIELFGVIRETDIETMTLDNGKYIEIITTVFRTTDFEEVNGYQVLISNSEDESLDGWYDSFSVFTKKEVDEVIADFAM